MKSVAFIFLAPMFFSPMFLACQRGYVPPCVLQDTITLVAAHADSLTRTSGGHIRVIYQQNGENVGGEWDRNGVLLNRVSAPAPGSDGALVNVAVVFDGTGLWTISPVFSNAADTQVAVQTPAGATVNLFQCSACSVVTQAAAVGDRVLVVSDVSGADAASFYSLDASGNLVTSGAFAARSPLLQGTRSDVLAAEGTQGWWLFDENGVALVGPIAVGGNAFDWNFSTARAAFVWDTLVDDSQETFAAVTNARGDGSVLHLSSGRALAVAQGAALTGSVFEDGDGLYFAAMNASGEKNKGEKIGGDVTIAPSVSLLSVAVAGEFSPGAFDVAYSSGADTAIAHVVCAP